MNYINAVGVELEGGWLKRPKHDLHNDASVRVKANHVGELASKPFKILENLEAWIDESAPDVVDGTCGFHIHISMKQRKHYIWLTSPRFYKLVLLRIKKWGLENKIPNDHHFWKRWRGTFKNPANNRNFCRKEFIPEKQLDNKEKGPDGSVRHCHLNYCLAMHGTLELRLFPAFAREKKELYFSAVKCFVDSVETFIEREKTRKHNRMRLKLEPERLVKRSLWQAA